MRAPHVHKILQDKALSRIAIVGVGLLGGSIGLALRARGFRGTRVGIGRRATSLEAAMQYGAVDEVTQDIATGVARADLVILCAPIGQFEGLMRAMAGALKPGTLVTDVGSTKVEVLRMARRCLPRTVRFVGSHPMAGSEKTGVEFARADLFERAVCLITPTSRTAPADVKWLERFWEALGGRPRVLTPQRHDALLARVSHLPHAVATALVRLALKDSAIDLAGPGFGDTTRIASGDAALWTDIFRTNSEAVRKALDGLIAELTRFRDKLARDDAEAIFEWLELSRRERDAWVARRYKKEEFPT
jgi:prephenate dehydrogenase